MVIHFIRNNSIGGLQNFCVALAKAQSKKMEVKVFYWKKTNLKAKDTEQVKKVTLKDLLGILFTTNKIIVHTHGNILSAVSLLAFFNKNIKVVHTVHNESRYESGKYRTIYHRFLFVRKLVFPVVISISLTEDFKQHYGFAPFSHVLNGIDTKSLPTALKADKNLSEYNILFLGRLDYQKNIDLLLKAVDMIVKNKSLKLKVHIAGSDMKHYDSALFENLVRDNQIIYYGLLQDPSALFSKCECICFSSIFEGVPIAAIEAKLSGLQLLSVNVGGIKDIIEPQDTLLPKRCTVEEYAEGILKSYSKRTMVQETKIDFSIARVASEYFYIYDNVLSENCT